MGKEKLNPVLQYTMCVVVILNNNLVVALSSFLWEITSNGQIKCWDKTSETFDVWKDIHTCVLHWDSQIGFTDYLKKKGQIDLKIQVFLGSSLTQVLRLHNILLQLFKCLSRITVTRCTYTTTALCCASGPRDCTSTGNIPDGFDLPTVCTHINGVLSR